MTENLSLHDSFLRIEDNLKYINENIARAAEKSGRSANDVKLMAVTKTVEPALINHAIKCGINLIGENRVQEFLGKKPFLNLENCEAHLIGHLQTNKVKQIVPEVSMIQSVDSLKVATEISKQSQKLGIVTNCLIEVNIGQQDSKSGISAEQTKELVCAVAELEGIKVKGLMAIPPICEEDAVLRRYFSKMYNMFIDIRAKKIDNVDMSVLSMGMSSDYVQAIEEGSTMVRVGSSVFGARVY